jgi:hypothetical protein
MLFRLFFNFKKLVESFYLTFEQKIYEIIHLLIVDNLQLTTTQD